MESGEIYKNIYIKKEEPKFYKYVENATYCLFMDGPSTLIGLNRWTLFNQEQLLCGYICI